MPQDVNSVSPGYNSGHVDLSKAPGADTDWDALFQNPENPTALQPQVAPGTPPTQQPQATPNQPFLKAGDSVYNTAEDAIAGVSHKDSEIAKYRTFLKENGVDPNTMQRVQAQPQVTQPPTTQSFFDKVSEAATKGDKQGYETAMRDFFAGLIDPWRPTLAEMNRFKAYQQVSRELPGFKEFYENGGYQEILGKNPLLKDMNQIGENDPVAAQRLPEVYRIAYFNYKGVQPVSQNTTEASPTTPTVAPRATLQPSALTPPAPVTQYAQNAWAQPINNRLKRDSNPAREALIQEGNQRFNGTKFEDFGL